MNYECDECVYEGTTSLDLKEHKTNIHGIKCDVCGHSVLTEKDLKGHKHAYHEDYWEEEVRAEKEIKEHKQDKHGDKSDSDQIQTIFLCNDCEKEYQVKSMLEEHIKNEHMKVEDYSCDKCEYTGISSNDLESHRTSIHCFFMYYCGACNFDTTNIDVLKQHKQLKHWRKITETLKTKVLPLAKCDPNDPSHTSECCNRDPKQKKPKIFTHEERKLNGICLDWNRGFCQNSDLCKYSHVEIEACRYASYCARSNCRFWHNDIGKFPFLESTRQQNTQVYW